MENGLPSIFGWSEAPLLTHAPPLLTRTRRTTALLWAPKSPGQWPLAPVGVKHDHTSLADSSMRLSLLGRRSCRFDEHTRPPHMMSIFARVPNALPRRRNPVSDMRVRQACGPARGLFGSPVCPSATDRWHACNSALGASSRALSRRWV